MIDIEKFDIGAMMDLNNGLAHACRGAVSEEDLATRTVQWFRENLASGGKKTCLLARYYKALPHSTLPVDLRAFAEKIARGLRPTTRCLTLLGTAGEEGAWNDRRRSAGHQAIPLASRELIERTPMISQLFQQFGVELDDFVGPNASLLDGKEREFNVFHVQEAAGSPYVPAQDFVRSYGVRSVLGLGAMQRDGGLFAVILFLRTAIDRATAQRFRPVPLTLKAALLRASVPVFSPSRG
jgi:hypothetical protein